jgi:hypothetical protein
MSSSRVTGDGRVILTSGEQQGYAFKILPWELLFEPKGRPPSLEEMLAASKYAPMPPRELPRNQRERRHG